MQSATKINLIYREYERVKTKSGNYRDKEIYSKKMLPNHYQLRVRILTNLFHSNTIRKISYLIDEDYDIYGETTAFQFFSGYNKCFINYKKRR